MSNLTKSALLAAIEDERADALKTHLQLADDGIYWGQIRNALTSKRAEVRLTVRTLAKLLDAKRYLEIGVWRGWGLAQVLAAQPHIKAVGVDSWQRNFSGVPNPGPDFVRAQMALVNEDADLLLIGGRSEDVLPGKFNAEFDLIFIDGERTSRVMQHDLAVAAALLSDGGVLVFDDLEDSREGGDRNATNIWEAFKSKFDKWHFIEVPDALTPFGVAIKPGATLEIPEKPTKAEKPAPPPKKTTAKKKRTTPASS